MATEQRQVGGIATLNGRKRPRVAILSTWHPEPADNGRKRRTRLMISALAGEYDVALISLLPPETPLDDLPAVPGVMHQSALSLPAFQPRSLAGLLGSVSLRPRSVVATWSKATARAIQERVTDLGIDVVVGTDLRTLRYLEYLSPAAATILDEPDVSPFVVENGNATLRATLRERKYRRLLKGSAPHLGAVVVASDLEAVAWLALAESGTVHVIENGVHELPAEQWQPHGSRDLLYTGSLEYSANAEAIDYFVGRILPLLEREAGDVSLVVTGKVPNPLPESARHPRVRLTGVLDSLSAAYLQSGVFVVPVLSGTGTRVKILEAMAHGVPVVSTAKGAEGLPVNHDRHLLLADRPEDFAAAVLRLLNDRELALRLGAAGRDLVRERFTWELQGQELRELVNSLVTAGGMQR